MINTHELYLESELKKTRKQLAELRAVVRECIEKFERPGLIVPELVEITKEASNARLPGSRKI